MNLNEKNTPNPTELAAELSADLEQHDFTNIEELREQLTRQGLILDQLFYTSLHSAGFGQTTSLSKEPLAAALIAQKQCRQLYDTLITAQIKKSCKQ